MVTILPAVQRGPSVGQRLSQGVGRALDMGSQLMQQNQQKQALQQLGIDPSVLSLPEQGQAAYFKNKFAPEKGMTPLQETQQRLAEARLGQIHSQEDLFNQLKGVSPQSQQIGEQQQPQAPSIDKMPAGNLEQLAAFKGQPGQQGVLGNMAQAEIDRREKEKELGKKEFLEERKYHSGYTKELEKNANMLRDSIPKKESALNFARSAVETGNVSFFSPDKLADATGLDIFRTAKGAQLVTASKENLLSNMGRVSARSQNLWFEQRLNSMFPKIGQSKEANLTTQEMLEGEVALDKAYLDEFDRMSQEDEKNYGYVKKDISRRVHQAIKPLENHIMQRTTYRMKEIEEEEKGLSSMKKDIGKNVVKGTPLTLAMAKLYKDKFGDNALDVAEKNGYYIPTIDEFRSYQERPQDFRENL